MKKILILVMCFSLILMFTACQNDNADLKDDNNDMIDKNDDVIDNNNDMNDTNNNNDNINNNDMNDVGKLKENTVITSVYTRRIDNDFIEIGENDNLGKYRLTQDIMDRFEDIGINEGDRVRYSFRTNDKGERELIDIERVE